MDTDGKKAGGGRELGEEDKVSGCDTDNLGESIYVNFVLADGPIC